MSDEPVQVGVARSLNVQVSSADVVDGLVVDHEGTVGVFEGGMGSQDGVVGLNHGGGDLKGRNCYIMTQLVMWLSTAL